MKKFRQHFKFAIITPSDGFTDKHQFCQSSKQSKNSPKMAGYTKCTRQSGHRKRCGVLYRKGLLQRVDRLTCGFWILNVFTFSKTNWLICKLHYNAAIYSRCYNVLCDTMNSQSLPLSHCVTPLCHYPLPLRSVIFLNGPSVWQLFLSAFESG